MATMVKPGQQQGIIERELQTAHEPEAVPARKWWAHLLWIAAAGALGFVIAAFFAGTLQLPRALFLVPYVALTLPFIYAYLRWTGIDIRRAALHHWAWGLAAAVIAGAFVVNNILNQPASPTPVGAELVGALLWFGVVYGAVDALLLSILPMLATWQALSALGWTRHWSGRIITGILALVASMVVTMAYHLGFPEYRNPSLMGPVVGNSVMSLASLVSMSPIGAVFSHIAMHIAAVLHGIETTVQLPPHYPM
jgi:hypothetical protein